MDYNVVQKKQSNVVVIKIITKLLLITLMKMFILIRGHFEHVQHVRMDKEEKFGDRNTKLCSIPKHLNVLKYKIVKKFVFAQDF